MSSVLIKTVIPAEGDTLFNVQPDEVNLGIGAPDRQTLQLGITLIKEAIAARLADPVESSYLLQYGPVSGDGQLLRTLATWLTKQYGCSHEPVKFSELFLTSGATSGLSLVCTLFGFAQGGTVFMEDPAYFIAGKVFDDHRMNKVPIRTDKDGLVIEDLEEKIAQLVSKGTKSNSRFSCLIYLVPTFNNPRGTILAESRRERLVKLAAKYDALVVCDDVYELLNYQTDRTPPRVVSFDNEKACVISNCSFSKIFGPGLRLGWIEARQPLIQEFMNSGIAASGGGMNHLTSGFLSAAIQEGIQDKFLSHVKATYSSRMQAVAEVIKAEFPPTTVCSSARGGFFLWVELPEKVQAEELLKICQREDKIGFQPGNWSSISGSYRNCMRLSIGFYTQEIILAAVRRIAFHLQKLL